MDIRTDKQTKDNVVSTIGYTFSLIASTLCSAVAMGLHWCTLLLLSVAVLSGLVIEGRGGRAGQSGGRVGGQGGALGALASALRLLSYLVIEEEGREGGFVKYILIILSPGWC